MDANGIKAALTLANDAYPVELVSTSTKGETIIHLGPMSVVSITSLPIGDAEIDWLSVGASGYPVPGSFYLIEGARVGGKSCRLVGTVAAS